MLPRNRWINRFAKRSLVALAATSASAGLLESVFGQSGTWTVMASYFDAQRDTWAPNPVALSQPLDWRAAESLDLHVADGGNAAAAWGEARGIWASFWHCQSVPSPE